MARLGHFLRSVKIFGVQQNLGAKICSSEKVDLGGYNLASKPS